MPATLPKADAKMHRLTPACRITYAGAPVVAYQRCSGSYYTGGRGYVPTRFTVVYTEDGLAHAVAGEDERAFYALLTELETA